MNTKNYLILELNTIDVLDSKGKVESRTYKWGDLIQLRIKRGMITEHINECMGAHDTWELKKGDRLYFLPGCSVPRFKVKMLGDTLGFSMTIKPKHATAAFISAQGLQGKDGLFDEHRDIVQLDMEIIQKWLTKSYGAKSQFIKRFESVIQNCEPNVLMKVNNLKWIFAANITTGKNIYKMDNRVPQALNYYIRKSAYSLPTTSLFTRGVNSIIDELTCPVYSQKTILKILNQNMITMTENQYETVRMQLKSGDRESIVIGMELMANCSYDKSSLYLLLLLAEFYRTLSNQKEVNHVNFKGLLRYFDLTPRKLQTKVKIDDLTHQLKQIKQFTRKNVQRLGQLYGSDKTDTHVINKYNTEYFHIGPVLKPEHESMLDEQFIDDTDELDLPDDNEGHQIQLITQH